MQDIVKVDVKKANEAEATEVKSSPQKKLPSLNKVTLAAVVVALGLFVGLVVVYQKYQAVKNNPSQAQAAQNSAETQRVLKKVKALILVDETQAPTVARVEDAAKLKKANAEFYKNIQKGDYLVIFPKRAIIYREDNNQIVNIAPIINAPAPAASTTQPATTTDKPATSR